MLDFTAIKYSNIFKRPPNKASQSTRLSGFTTELETPPLGPFVIQSNSAFPRICGSFL